MGESFIVRRGISGTLKSIGVNNTTFSFAQTALQQGTIGGSIGTINLKLNSKKTINLIAYSTNSLNGTTSVSLTLNVGETSAPIAYYMHSGNYTDSFAFTVTNTGSSFVFNVVSITTYSNVFAPGFTYNATEYYY